jgi:hypothetical protein
MEKNIPLRNKLLAFLSCFLIASVFVSSSLPAQAVVPTTNSTSSATGDGVTNTFTFTFELLQASDMVVYVNKILQTQSTAYIVNPTGGSYPCTGGTITFQTGFIPPALAVILMTRQLTLTQTISLPVEGSLPSSTLQTVFDRASMQIQQINTQQMLSLQLPITSVGVNTALPTPVALNIFGWDSTGANVVNYTPQAIVAQAVNSGVIGPGVSTVGHIALFNNTTGSLLSDLAPGASGNLATSNGTVWTSAVPPVLGFSQVRLYLVSGAPEADGSSSGNATVYVGPYKGNLLTQDNGSGVLSTVKLTELSSSISSLVSGDAYSVYEYNNAGTQTVEIDQDWTNPTTPPTFGTDTLGRRTKTGATNKLLIGALYCSATGKTNDYNGERSVSNELNAIPKYLFCTDTTVSYAYNNTTVRAADANTTNGQGRVTSFSINANRVINLNSYQQTQPGSSGLVSIGIGVNSITTPNVIGVAYEGAGITNITSVSCPYSSLNTIGLNYYQRLEADTANSTFYYTNNTVTPSNYPSSGMTGITYN